MRPVYRELLANLRCRRLWEFSVCRLRNHADYPLGPTGSEEDSLPLVPLLKKDLGNTGSYFEDFQCTSTTVRLHLHMHCFFFTFLYLNQGGCLPVICKNYCTNFHKTWSKRKTWAEKNPIDSNVDPEKEAECNTVESHPNIELRMITVSWKINKPWTGTNWGIRLKIFVCYHSNSNYTKQQNCQTGGKQRLELVFCLLFK